MPSRRPAATATAVDSTLVATDFPAEIKNLRTTMASVREVTDVARLKAQIAELEQQSSVPDLWDDQDLSLIHI